jgi:hypothetical protein
MQYLSQNQKIQAEVPHSQIGSIGRREYF